MQRRAERRTGKDRRKVSRSGRRKTDVNADEREWRIAQQLEFLEQQKKRRNKTRES